MKITKDEKWFDVVQKVRWRDSNTCQLWRVLLPQEKLHVLDVFLEDMFLNALDCAHIIPKSERPDLYYDLDNIVLICRYFHILLDTFLHPITRKPITKEERIYWLTTTKEKCLFFDGNNYILENKQEKDMSLYKAEKTYERNEEYDLYKKLTDKQLKKAVQECISHKLYQSDEFTDIVKNIMEFEKFSEKQRRMLIKHLAKFEDINLKE